MGSYSFSKSEKLWRKVFAFKFCILEVNLKLKIFFLIKSFPGLGNSLNIYGCLCLISGIQRCQNYWVVKGACYWGRKFCFGYRGFGFCSWSFGFILIVHFRNISGYNVAVQYSQNRPQSLFPSVYIIV